MCLFQFWFPQSVWLGVGLLGHMVVLFLLFNLQIIFHSDCYQFTFPPAMQKCSLFSTPSTSFIVCRHFDDGHSDPCVVISHCSFDLHFSNNEQCLASFLVFVSCQGPASAGSRGTLRRNGVGECRERERESRLGCAAGSAVLLPPLYFSQ